MFLQSFLKTKKRSKFNNKKVVFENIKFDSMLECNCYKSIKKYCELNNLAVLLQVPYQITPKRKYIADFVVKCASTGKSLIIDAKGILTDIFKMKSELMEIKHQKVYCAKSPSEAIKIIKHYLK